MPTKNARVNVVLEKPLYAAVDEIAKRQGLSRSMVVRDLVREAIELREDLALAAFAERREQSFDTKKAITHEDVWG
ncbi:MAG TPA: ribbon-helix-helix domain-containing protein [Syntrophorhabdaceae bacterium]|nr:ribbon-helix-helix domain-containing protein [Syntrophorhabdaceae bacterium]